MTPFTHGTHEYTRIMKTVALREALDEGGYDAAFGGARRDEERSRAKERVFSLREPGHRWEPRKQRPEFWRTANTQLSEGQTMRVFPMSNWTELDVWRYIQREGIEVVPLYFAKERPVVERDGQLIMVDDDRYPLKRRRAARDAQRPVPHPRLLPAHRGRGVDGRQPRRPARGDAASTGGPSGPAG